jgi:hypothetical protein
MNPFTSSRKVIISILLLSIIIIAFIPSSSFCQKSNVIHLSDSLSAVENDSDDTADDTTGNYAQELLDKQNDENDQFDSLWDNYYSYGFFGKAGYTTDMQYRGYQGAGAQSAFFPGLVYNHPIGLGAFINVYNIKGTTVPWDEIEIGLLYNHSFSERLSMSLSYTHYTFNDTSEISKQGITGIAGVNLSYEFPLLSTGASFDVSSAEQIDYSFSINFSKRIDLFKTIFFRCWFEPDFSGIYGTQVFLNNKIDKILMGKGKGKNVTNIVTTTTNHAFSVLAYQLSLPINIQVGRFIITPRYDYIIPLNQPTSTNSSAFGFFTMNISVKIF